MSYPPLEDAVDEMAQSMVSRIKTTRMVFEVKMWTELLFLELVCGYQSGSFFARM